MPLVTRRHPFRLNTIHPSVLGDTHSAWFGWKWVGTRRERVLFNSGKDDDANADADADLDVLAAAYHRLLLHYLHVERRSYEKERDDRVSVSATGDGGGRDSSCSSHRLPRLTSLAVDFDGEEDEDCNPTTRGGADVVIVSWIGSRADLAIDLHRRLQ